MIRFVLLALCFCGQASAQFTIGDPFYVSAFIKAQSGGGGTPCDSVNDASLAAYWPLDEASGTRTDTKNGNNLTDNNTVTSGTGKISNAGQFTAANSEYLSIADNASVSLGADTDFTIWAWINPDSDLSAAARTVIAKGTGGGTGVEFAAYSISSFMGFQVDNGASTGAVYTNLPSVGNWQFYAWGHDSTANVLWVSVNGGSRVEAAWSGGTQNTTGALRIGHDPTGSTGYFDGRIDEVGYTKRMLTSGEITALYAAGAACRPTGL